MEFESRNLDLLSEKFLFFNLYLIYDLEMYTYIYN